MQKGTTGSNYVSRCVCVIHVCSTCTVCSDTQVVLWVCANDVCRTCTDTQYALGSILESSTSDMKKLNK